MSRGRLLLRDPLGRVSVRDKLALAFVGVCLLAFGVGGYLVSSSAKSALEDEILRRLDFQCQTYSDALDSSLVLLRRRIEDFASDGYIRDRAERMLVEDGAGRALLQRELRDHLRRNKLPLVHEFLDLMVVTCDRSVGTSVREAAWSGVREGPIIERSAVTSFQPADATDPYPTFDITTPVYGLQHSDIVGEIRARVHSGLWLSEALAGQGFEADDELLEVRLIDTEARRLEVHPRLFAGLESDSELVRSGFGLRLADRTEPSTGLDAAGPTGHGVFDRTLPLGASGWRLQLSLPTDQVLMPVTGLQSRVLIVGLGLALLAGVLCSFPMRFIARPLTQLRDASQRLREGDFEVRVPVASKDEIGELARSFNEMAGALQERTQRLEQTAAHLEQRSLEWRRERDRLDAVIRSMHDGLVVLDADGEVVLSNGAARPLLNSLRDLERAVAGHHRCADRDAARGGCRSCLLDPHGPLRSCLVDVGHQVYEIHSTGLRPDETGRAGRVLLSREITDRIDQDEQQIHQERLAVLGEVAAVMAHELNNPLAAINMFSQMLLTDLPEDSAHREAAEVIQRNTQACKKTIRELLDYATGACPEVGTVDVHETVRDVLRFLEPISRRTGMDVHWELDAASPVVSGDEIQVRQIFVNLIMNALQATGRRGGRVRIASHLDGEHLVVDVEDDGPGIDPVHQGTIFRPFFTTKPRGEGTGLGLSTARRLAEMHGGGIELLESKPGATRFRVRLHRSSARTHEELAWNR